MKASNRLNPLNRSWSPKLQNFPKMHKTLRHPSLPNGTNFVVHRIYSFIHFVSTVAAVVCVVRFSLRVLCFYFVAMLLLCDSIILFATLFELLKNFLRNLSYTLLRRPTVYYTYLWKYAIISTSFFFFSINIQIFLLFCMSGNGYIFIK